MPRKGRKKVEKKAPLNPNIEQNDAPIVNDALHFQERQRAFNNREVERRTSAIQAICEAETQHLLSTLRLLRSYLNKEQLETPALKFFQENFPYATVRRNEKYQVFELEWNKKNDILSEIYYGGKYDRASLSNAFNMPAFSGLQFSVDSVKRSLLETANLQMRDYGLDEPNEDQGKRNEFETPGAISNRLSFGMTPKTLREPKYGEMLLSVRGSPLGVYKEESLAAIHECGDGSKEDAC